MSPARRSITIPRPRATKAKDWMPPGKKNPKVDKVLSTGTQWRKELEKLREIILECGLTEVLKWGQPCYTVDGRNIALIHGFKEYCAILFIKGVLLQDAEGILIRQTEHVQAGRHIRFTTVRDIEKLEPVIKAYLYEAIEVEKAGLKVKMKKTEDFTIPDEFQTKLDAMPALKKAFDALTPGRQRGYIFHFSQPKLSKTREARVEKSIALILAGKGLND